MASLRLPGQKDPMHKRTVKPYYTIPTPTLPTPHPHCRRSALGRPASQGYISSGLERDRVQLRLDEVVSRRWLEFGA